MPTEGVVDALKKLQRSLRPGGVLLDLHPEPRLNPVTVRTSAGTTGAGVLGYSESFIETIAAADEALGMPFVLCIQRGLLVGSHRQVTTGENLLGCEARQATVVMLEVVPVKIGLAPPACMGIALEAPGIVWLVFLCLELADAFVE